MPLQKLSFRPGLNTQLSKTANEGGWSDANYVRFRDGLPEKWAGWITLSSQGVAGIPRALWSWAELGGYLDAAIGTSSKLYLFRNGTLYDLTPLRMTRTVTAAFQTTAGSALVVLTDAAHATSFGDFVEISGASAVGGITLNGEYVVSPITANTYSVTASANAISTATGGGTATIQYLLPVGAANATNGAGIGYNVVGFGLVGTAPASGTFGALPRQWSLVNWGEFLLAVPRDGTLYVWTPASGATSRAIAVTNTPGIGPPLQIRAMLVGMPERHLILLGCSNPGVSSGFDPMLVRWSDVEDYTNYVATAFNSAGSFRLQGGTHLVCGLNVTGQNLIWSDSALFSMRFTGAPYFYAFDQLSAGCGIVGPHAMATYAGVTYWMGTAAFYAFEGGAPVEIDCSEWGTVFLNLNAAQLDMVTCGVNSTSNEVIWFYPSTGSFICNAYVAYNYIEQSWTTGNIDRTSWNDRGVFSNPIATDSAGRLYQHEIGLDGGGYPMDAFIQSGFLDIGDGTEFMFIDKIIPDFVRQNGNVLITVSVTDYPNSTPTNYGPFLSTPGTQFISLRARGRQAAFRFETNGFEADFRLGAVRVNASPDGRR